MPDRDKDILEGVGRGFSAGFSVPSARSWTSRWLASREGKLLDNMGGVGSSRRELLGQLGNMYRTHIYGDTDRMAHDYAVREISPIGVGSDLGRKKNNFLTDAVRDASNPVNNGLHVNLDAPGQNSMIYVKPGGGQRGDQSTLVHELAHSLGRSQFNWLTKPQEREIYGIMGSAKFLKGRDDSYIDSPREIYSRLMEFRYNNKLDPKKEYSVEEVRKMRESAKDADIFNRYDDETIRDLLNKVASVSGPDTGVRNS